MGVRSSTVPVNLGEPGFSYSPRFFVSMLNRGPALGSGQQVGQGQEGGMAPHLPQAIPTTAPEPTPLPHPYRHQRVLDEQWRL